MTSVVGLLVTNEWVIIQNKPNLKYCPCIVLVRLSKMSE
jgi:hypothetical protein